MNRFRRPFLEEILDMIRELEIPEHPDDTFPVEQIQTTPFRAVFDGLVEDDRTMVALDWLRFTTALNAKQPSRHALRMALMPLRIRLDLADPLPMERDSEREILDVYAQLSEAAQAGNVAELADVALEAGPVLDLMTTDDFAGLIDTAPLVERTGEFSPDELRGRGDDDQAVEVERQPMRVEREPATGLPMIPTSLQSSVDELRSLADDLSALVKLDALEVLGAHPNLQVAARAALAAMEQDPSLARLFKGLGEDLQRTRRWNPGEHVTDEPWIADAMRRVASNLVSLKQPSTVHELPLPAPTTPKSTPLPEPGPELTLPTSNPWRARFIAVTCAAVVCIAAANAGLYQAKVEKHRALDYQAEQFAVERDTTIDAVVMPVRLSADSPVWFVVAQPNSTHDFRFRLEMTERGSGDGAPEITGNIARQGMVFTTNESRIYVQLQSIP